MTSHCPIDVYKRQSIDCPEYFATPVASVRYSLGVACRAVLLYTLSLVDIDKQ